MTGAEIIEGSSGSRTLIIADHASNAVPDDIDLGVDPARMNEHVAFDIGTAGLATGLSAKTGAPAVLATVSRLVVDCNRALDDPAVIPAISDDIAIPGNRDLSDAARSDRIQRYYRSYHDAVSSAIDGGQARLLVSIHSFTPMLASMREPRPWQVGLLYNRDDRAARVAMQALASMGFTVGDNQPYSGTRFGYTTDRHAEARGLPYLTFEVRQDLVSDTKGVEEWIACLSRVITIVESKLFAELEEINA